MRGVRLDRFVAAGFAVSSRGAHPVFRNFLSIGWE